VERLAWDAEQRQDRGCFGQQADDGHDGPD
jgi:hypothetical protein